MTEDLLVSPQYWGVFTAAMIAFLAIKYRPLDFKFFTALPVAQRIAHTSLLPSSYMSSFVFSVLTGILLIVGYVVVDRCLPTKLAQESVQISGEPSSKNLEVKGYIFLSGMFLAAYFAIRFADYPTFFSALSYAERVQAQFDHRTIFFLFLAVPPAITAIALRWLLNGRLNKWDIALATTILAGYLTLGSKASIMPVLMTYFGVATYLKKEGLLRRAVWVVTAMVIIGAAALTVLFPNLSGSEITELIANRVVASTEELEYLYVLNLQPDQYPFAGIGALVAPAAKLFGQEISYPPGVWLYGQRYGDFSGYGPNSGFVIEFFGNLGFFGLAMPLIIGATIAYCEKRTTLYRVVLLSIIPLIFSESLMFIVALCGHLTLMLGAKAVRLLFAINPMATPARQPSALDQRTFESARDRPKRSV